MSEQISAMGLGLMCKPPRPGATKTRLAAGVGAETAARLSRAFLTDCANAAAAAAEVAALDLVAFYSPPDAERELAAVLGERWPLAFANRGDLGETMLSIMENLLSRSPGGAIIMGADTPLIQAETIATAARALRESSENGVVVGPTVDGGYWLIGLRCAKRAASLFAPMNWSTQGVFAETMRRAQTAGLDLVTLPPQRDIDELADLQWLQGELARCDADCPATRTALASLPQAHGHD